MLNRQTTNIERHSERHSGLLGYAKWENFAKVIEKAKIACRNAGHSVEDHFPDVRKMVDIGSGAERPIDDIALTRYACYLIAQNGDPRKVEIAFAQTYFAVQTRKLELIEKRLEEQERLTARQKLTLSEPLVLSRFRVKPSSGRESSPPTAWSSLPPFFGSGPRRICRPSPDRV